MAALLGGALRPLARALGPAEDVRRTGYAGLSWRWQRISARLTNRPCALRWWHPCRSTQQG
eukprot:4274170-Alexandrium_andersonii.AAC.1